MMRIKFFIIVLLLAICGGAMAQCYQPTMNAARQEERGGNYQRAAQLYREAQNCFEATAQQKTAAKKKEAECRQRAQAAEQRKREEEARKAAGERRKAEAHRQAEAAAERKRKEEEAAAERNRKKENLTLTVGGVSFKMVWVEGGTFTMGCTPEQGGDCEEDEAPAHSVTLDGYYMGETEVTQALWTAVMGTTVRQQRDKADPPLPLSGKGNNYPMYYVNYDEAVQFARKLSQLTGRTFSLPTEAEWEYAARGGSKSRGYKYAGSNGIDAVAWYDGNSGDQNHPVAQKAANELGLYDMSGNVWEWCSDWKGGYSSGAQRNPTGPGSGFGRVLRGGGWYGSAWSCRVSGRSYNDSTGGNDGSGFRLVFRP
jgi:formylglycine-generating enzyme required for sulfatase activity